MCINARFVREPYIAVWTHPSGYCPLIARFMGRTWGPMLATWTLLSGDLGSCGQSLRQREIMLTMLHLFSVVDTLPIWTKAILCHKCYIPDRPFPQWHYVYSNDSTGTWGSRWQLKMKTLLRLTVALAVMSYCFARPQKPIRQASDEGEDVILSLVPTLLAGNPSVTYGSSAQRTGNVEFWCHFLIGLVKIFSKSPSDLRNLIWLRPSDAYMPQ